MDKTVVQPLTADEVAAFAAELPEHERRFLPGDVSLEGTDKGPRIHMLIPYDTPSEEMHSRSIGDFTEVVRPTAFTKTAQEHRSSILSLWNHNTDFVLGRLSNGTMEMRSTPAGMMADVQLDGQDPMHLGFARRVERRDVTGSSFGFDPVRAPVTRSRDGALRELVEVRLHDIGPVAMPAYPASSAEKRSADAVVEVASVRAGVDLDALAGALVRMESRRIAAGDLDGYRATLKQLAAFLPPEQASAVPLGVRMRRLALVARRNGLELRAASSAPWSRPTLSDFTDKLWGDLSKAEKERIGSHFAWAPADAATFGELKLPFKEPKSGKVSLAAVRNALSRLPQTQGIPQAEKDKIEAKLERLLGEKDGDEAAA